MTTIRFLRQIVSALETAAVPYVVVGSFASTHHGLPRSTSDVDVVVDLDEKSMLHLVALLEEAGFYVSRERAKDALRRRRMFNAIDAGSGWKADFIVLADDPYERQKLARRQRADLAGVEAWVATAEDTILSKLRWARDSESRRQLDDVAGVLQVRGEMLDRAYLECWLDALGVRDLWDRLADQSPGSGDR